MSDPVLRPAISEDADFLWQMLVAAVAWDRPGSPFTTGEVRRIPDYAVYVDDWGRDTDIGIVAESAGTPIGAAWLRYFDPAAPSFGYLGPDVPELAIGITDGQRGQGLGRALLRALFAAAREANIALVSLSVEKANPAVRLYERLGFEVVRDQPAALVMTYDVTRTDSELTA